MFRTKYTYLFLALIMAITLFVGCSTEPTTPKTSTNTATQAEPSAKAPQENVELIIATAASLTDVSKELALKYNETNPNVTLTFTYGASGALQTQIEEGAPVDIFMSAGEKQMKALQEKGLIIEETNKPLVENEAVLISPIDSALGITSFEDCATDKVKTIAIGDPETSPAGQCAQDIFIAMGIWEGVEAKIIYGADVRQVLTWVALGQVDCGVVFKTDALASDKVKTVAKPPEEFNVKSTYPVAVVATSDNIEEAKKFEEFLYMDDAKVIFEKYGFEMVTAYD